VWVVRAMAARKLVFEPVVAIDVDEEAVEATRRNAAANGVDLDASLLDAGSGALPQSEVAVANIDLPTISRLKPSPSCRMLVTSGHYRTDHPAIAGFDHVGRRASEEPTDHQRGREAATRP